MSKEVSASPSESDLSEKELLRLDERLKAGHKFTMLVRRYNTQKAANMCWQAKQHYKWRFQGHDAKFTRIFVEKIQ